MRLARASGSHAVLRSATRTDSDQNHTSQALELAAGGCGKTVSSALLIHAQKLPVSPLAAPGGALASHIPVRGQRSPALLLSPLGSGVTSHTHLGKRVTLPSTAMRCKDVSASPVGQHSTRAQPAYLGDAS